MTSFWKRKCSYIKNLPLTGHRYYTCTQAYTYTKFSYKLYKNNLHPTKRRAALWNDVLLICEDLQASLDSVCQEYQRRNSRSQRFDSTTYKLSVLNSKILKSLFFAKFILKLIQPFSCVSCIDLFYNKPKWEIELCGTEIWILDPSEHGNQSLWNKVLHGSTLPSRKLKSALEN